MSGDDLQKVIDHNELNERALVLVEKGTEGTYL